MWPWIEKGEFMRSLVRQLTGGGDKGWQQESLI